MARLTENIDYCFLKCVEREEDKATIRENCPMYRNCQDRLVWEALKFYEDADEQGLLLRLPCNPGAKVYSISGGQIYEETVDGIEYTKNGFELWKHEDIFIRDVWLGILGDSVFLTKAEAEKALAEMG